MNQQISDTKRWLDQRYSRKVDGHYYAHQPIYGYDSQYSEPNAILRIVRMYHLLKLLDGIQFSSMLDVGGGEGYVAGLIKQLHEIEPITTDLSSEACARARELFRVHSVSSDASRLPFQDSSFDLILCSEVIEHLTTPVLTISELVRVARKYVVITTSEFCPLGELERSARMCLMDYDYPHAEKNWFTQVDFESLLGNRLLFHSQMDNLGGRSVDYLASAELTREQIEKVLEYMTSSTSLNPNHDGVIVLDNRDSEVETASIQSAYQSCQSKSEFFNLLLNPFSTEENSALETAGPGDYLIDKLMCLVCGGSCEFDGKQLVCKACRHAYEVVNGVPVMLVDNSKPPMQIHTQEYAIQLLSQGDPDKAAQVTQAVRYLHGKRPVCTSSFRRTVARAFLRLYWLLMRPEPFQEKVKRVFSKIVKMNQRDDSAIEAKIFSG